LNNLPERMNSRTHGAERRSYGQEHTSFESRTNQRCFGGMNRKQEDSDQERRVLDLILGPGRQI
jgi:hypothetical protein